MLRARRPDVMYIPKAGLKCSAAVTCMYAGSHVVLLSLRSRRQDDMLC